MRTNAGGIVTSVVALFLGVLVVTQFRSQDVYSRSLQLETPASLTTLIASLSVEGPWSKFSTLQRPMDGRFARR